MPRAMLDDPTRSDPRALIRTSLFALVSDIVAPRPKYLHATSDATIVLDANVAITVGNSVFATERVSLGSHNLDAGTSFVIGSDYYVYICDPAGGSDEMYLISLNSTAPLGFNALNSRKIGGFHFGMCRRVDDMKRPVNPAGEPWGTGWEANVYLGIVPDSVWTIKHRPCCSPEGMVYLGSKTWVDIYLSSSDGADGLQSAYGEIPITGTEGHNFYSFNDRALSAGKRLMNYAEYMRMAYGSPQGLAGDNTNAWSGATARNRAGLVDRATSSIGARDAVGNLWEWLDEFITRASGVVLNGTTSPATFTYASWDGGRAGVVNTNGTAHGPTTRSNENTANGIQGAWAWDRDTPLGDTTGGNRENGNIHQYYDWSLVALRSGGHWGSGAQAGSRAVDCNNRPWSVNTAVGVRLACESL